MCVYIYKRRVVQDDGLAAASQIPPIVHRLGSRESNDIIDTPAVRWEAGNDVYVRVGRRDGEEKNTHMPVMYT